MYILVEFSDIEDYYPVYEIMAYNKDKEPLEQLFKEKQEVIKRNTDKIYELKEITFEQLKNFQSSVKFTITYGEKVYPDQNEGFAIVHLK